jgi:hypothetical protein
MNLYAIGTKENMIQDILRHADVKITRSFYIRPPTESAQRAMKGLEKLFKSLKKVKRSGRHKNRFRADLAVTLWHVAQESWDTLWDKRKLK